VLLQRVEQLAEMSNIMADGGEGESLGTCVRAKWDSEMVESGWMYRTGEGRWDTVKGMEIGVKLTSSCWSCST
jgi:hypothetical protein